MKEGDRYRVQLHYSLNYHFSNTNKALILSKICLFFYFRRSAIFRDEVYTSITDTIEMPKVFFTSNDSLQHTATSSPNIFATTKLNHSAFRHLHEVGSTCLYIYICIYYYFFHRKHKLMNLIFKVFLKLENIIIEMLMLKIAKVSS